MLYKKNHTYYNYNGPSNNSYNKKHTNYDAHDYQCDVTDTVGTGLLCAWLHLL